MKKTRRDSIFTWLGRTVSEFLYPAKCICCRRNAPVGIAPSEVVMLVDPHSARRQCFCESCMSGFLTSMNAVCGVCGKSYRNCECSTEALRRAGIARVYACFGYDKTKRNSPSSRLIYSIKSAENLDSIDFGAQLLCARIRSVLGDSLGADTVLTYAPRRKSAAREHGDHMRLTAKRTAEFLGIECVDAFVNKSRGEQKKKHIDERIKSASESISLRRKSERMIRGRRVVIIDDVITSGATLGACAALANGAGADSVSIFALAKTIMSKISEI